MPTLCSTGGTWAKGQNKDPMRRTEKLREPPRTPELSKNHGEPLLSASQLGPSLSLLLIPPLPGEAGIVVSVLQRVMGSR